MSLNISQNQSKTFNPRSLISNICSLSIVIYIVSGISLAGIVAPAGLTLNNICCPVLVLIPVYELSGTFSNEKAKIN